MKFNCEQCGFEHEIFDFVAKNMDVVCDCGAIIRCREVGRGLVCPTIARCPKCEVPYLFKEGVIYCSSCKDSFGK